MLYSVKIFTYKTERDPKDRKKMIRIRECVTVKSGLTWNQAKEMRKKDHNLIIFEGSEGPADGEQIMNTVAQETPKCS